MNDNDVKLRELEKIYTEITMAKKIGEATDDDAIKKVLILADNATKSDELYYLKITKNKSYSIGIRIIGFYVLCTKYRRDKENSKFNNLIHDNYSVFNNEEIYKIQKAYSLITCNTNKNQFLEAFNMWENIDDRYRRMPAFIQIYTETVALCFENDFFDIKSISHKEILQEAIELINIGIKRRDYAKFYATLGRLQHCNNDYEIAIANINKAIDKETPDRKDYSIRIGEYQLIITKIEMSVFTEKKLKELETYKTGLDEMKNELSKSKYDNLSFLGFFSAIVSLIIGTVQTTMTSGLVEKYQLLMALAGVLIISFGSLNLLMMTTETLKKAITTAGAMVAFGLLLIVLSIILIPRII